MPEAAGSPKRSEAAVVADVNALPAPSLRYTVEALGQIGDRETFCHSEKEKANLKVVNSDDLPLHPGSILAPRVYELKNGAAGRGLPRLPAAG
jgi:hypothetical protein